MASSSSPVMASSSSSPRNWRYNVFTSFHGPDARQTILSHLRKQFTYNGITMFDDEGMERSEIIASSLKKAIIESRIAIVLLTKNYASSSWCLDELLEIMKCKEESEQIVMTVFYGVDPSEVRDQTGDFGIAFNETCARKTEEKRQKWSEALTYVGNIAGEHFMSWKNEAEMIEKIASDVSDKLNVTPCKDFDDMVGLDAHLKKMVSLLDLDHGEAKIVGISGPAGIGKSTISRALHSMLSKRFQHTCFIGNVRGNYKIGLDEYGSKLSLQKKLLSDILKQNSMQIRHLGLIKDRLGDKKVLIILDDVENLVQLQAFADITWFGPGSRVIVVTENKEILQQHGIKGIYHVGFPSDEEALKIFCLSAFRQTSPSDEFLQLAYKIISICGNLPLGLHVLGSSLWGKSQADWIDELPRLKLDGRIKSVLKLGYESLHEKDQSLFLLIAIYFNYKDINEVTSTLYNADVVDVRLGLKNLANRHLIIIHGKGMVEMHHLLQVMAKEVNSKKKISKRKILEDPQDICYVLKKAKVNKSALGLSLDVAKIDESIISEKAFINMYNLLILEVKGGRRSGERKLHVPENMKLPPSLRLLSWEAYPRNFFQIYPVNLVRLIMQYSELEKLWEGTLPLANLKEMNLCRSSRLKELPDLSKATNLEELDVDNCESLEVIPSLINLTSIKCFQIFGCPRLRSFPEMPTNITVLKIEDTGVEELPLSFRHCSKLKRVLISDNVNLKTFSTHLPTSVEELDLSDSSIESIADCIKGLHKLKVLNISDCKRLESLPELPESLIQLYAINCESLKIVSGSLNSPHANLHFGNSFRLGREANRAIIQRSVYNGWTLFPGIEVPEEFDYRGRGPTVTVPRSDFDIFKDSIGNKARGDSSLSDFNRVKVCLVTPILRYDLSLTCTYIGNSVKYTYIEMYIDEDTIGTTKDFDRKHLLIFTIKLPLMGPSEMSKNIKLHFAGGQFFGCGVKILRDETDGTRRWGANTDNPETDHSGIEPDDRENYKLFFAGEQLLDETDETKLWGANTDNWETDHSGMFEKIISFL